MELSLPFRFLSLEPAGSGRCGLCPWSGSFHGKGAPPPWERSGRILELVAAVISARSEKGIEEEQLQVVPRLVNWEPKVSVNQSGVRGRL